MEVFFFLKIETIYKSFSYYDTMFAHASISHHIENFGSLQSATLYLPILCSLAGGKGARELLDRLNHPLFSWSLFKDSDTLYLDNNDFNHLNKYLKHMLTWVRVVWAVSCSGQLYGVENLLEKNGHPGITSLPESQVGQLYTNFFVSQNSNLHPSFMCTMVCNEILWPDGYNRRAQETCF